jgi:hypothetical protein
MSETIRTKPLLWEKVKKSVKKSSKGGLPGTWTARKAQLSVLLYKQKGGGYKGKKSSSNSLVRWSKQKWGYINKKKKTGRYLPQIVRNQLTNKEKSVENRRKGNKKGKRIPYSESVRRKVSKVTRISRK